MLNWFASIPVWVQALLATSFTYGVTALGAACVYFFKKENKKVLSCMQGIAAGVMIAASFFSLLKPAQERLGDSKHAWWILCVSFLVGGLFICITDIFFLHRGKRKKDILGQQMHTQNSIADEKNEQNLQATTSSKKKSGKKQVQKASRAEHTFLAMTLHNIPEGFAVGVAFGSILGNDMSALAAAIVLTLGIGIQNFPEGMCVSLCARQEGASLNRSFFLGQFSGFVEVVAGVIGAVAVSAITTILPWALAFSAGAMVAVACVELIPDAVASGKKLATFSIILGFVIMMALDVAL